MRIISKFEFQLSNFHMGNLAFYGVKFQQGLLCGNFNAIKAPNSRIINKLNMALPQPDSRKTPISREPNNPPILLAPLKKPVAVERISIGK